jgi:deoxyribodipyrimidine photo-lyase
MHNRVRMIVASFLIKHLMIPWQDGEAWFWDTLVDADLASNAGNWQWVAGCGADAAPYFRIFNPVLQGRKFDADGGYVRRFVPELAALDAKYIHAPWEAPRGILAEAGVTLARPIRLRSWTSPRVAPARWTLMPKFVPSHDVASSCEVGSGHQSIYMIDQ